MSLRFASNEQASRLIAEGVRWEVHTERDQETNRMGYGVPDLALTIEHLARRGDRACRVWNDNSQAWTPVALSGLA